MPLLNPSIEIIRSQKVQPTEGEWALLKFLLENLDDTYEIYFQPFLNGDNPDFAIMRKGSGVLLIEVKDWNLAHYSIDEKTAWRLVKDENVRIESPLQQVLNYKENLINLHIEELFLKNIENNKHWATVNCAVYFHCATEKDLSDFLLSKFQGDFEGKDYKSYRKFVNNFELLGSDSLQKERFNKLLTKFWLNRQSYYFDDTLYKGFQRYLQAPIHKIEEGKNITYTKEQQELIQSIAGQKRKIKGVAGCGKTLVLAKRAVNAHVRTGGRVLILTYNLSLKNYLHDRISDVREEFLWRNFYITNYHSFFKVQATHYNLKADSFNDWDDKNFFESVQDRIQKFDCVFIDEIQDYKQEWIDIITTYFTHQDTEFVVFGDEKQNIYDREMDENREPKIKTVPGRWNKSLNTSHRFGSSIASIALEFQKTFLAHRYTVDEFKVLAQFDFEKRVIEYHRFRLFEPEKIVKSIYSVLEKNNIHSSDAGILSSKIEPLRMIDYLIRTNRGEKTETTFESQEEFEKITGQRKGATSKVVKDKLDAIRRNRKYHFWMKTGTVKLSTTNSFKGWEIDTLFLLIENDKKEDLKTNAEMIYTGLTRAKRNLILLNIGNFNYEDFFTANIQIKYNIG